MNFRHWIHHLFNPHCDKCEFYAENSKVCQSCETLKMQLSISNSEKRQMLETILSFTKSAEREPAPVVNYEKIQPKAVTWNVRRQMLEEEDRVKARVMAEQKRADEIAKLEKELGVEEVKEDVKA